MVPVQQTGFNHHCDTRHGQTNVSVITYFSWKLLWVAVVLTITICVLAEFTENPVHSGKHTLWSGCLFNLIPMYLYFNASAFKPNGRDVLGHGWCNTAAGCICPCWTIWLADTYLLWMWPVACNRKDWSCSNHRSKDLPLLMPVLQVTPWIKPAGPISPVQQPCSNLSQYFALPHI